MKILTALLLVFVAIPALGQNTGTPKPFSITISPQPAEAKAGSQIGVGIQMRNLSDHDVECTVAPSNGVDRAYRYEVWDASGKLLPRRKRKHPEIGETFSIRPPCSLKPGGVTDSSAIISTLYDLTSPGTYTVRVSRPIKDQDSKSGMIYSNKIKIAVTP